MFEVEHVRLIAGGASTFQFCALVGFYMTTPPNMSISHVLMNNNESMCIGFTIVFSLLAYIELLNLVFYFAYYVPPSSDVRPTGVEAALICAWTLALTLRYPLGTGPHFTCATVFILFYLLALFLQQYEGFGRSWMTYFVGGVYCAGAVALGLWVYTGDNGFEWVAWGLLTLVQCMLNLPLRPLLSTPQVWAFSHV